MSFTLRTRTYTDLTNYEIEKYLERNDIIVIPVGNCETHAGYPVDCEFVMVEGYARLIAEKVDGLFLPNVVYFNPGGTRSAGNHPYEYVRELPLYQAAGLLPIKPGV